MNAETKNEIVGALRHCAKRECRLCEYQGRGIACKHHLMTEAADLIESLQAQFVASQARERAAICASADK